MYNVTVCVEKIIGNYQCGFRCIDHDGSHIVYWSDCGGRILRGEGSADCKKSYDSIRMVVLFNFSIRLNIYETIIIGRIVINCNCITVRIGKCLSAVCPIVFSVKQKDALSLFAFKSASVYAYNETRAKYKCIEFNASEGAVGVVLT